MEYTAVQDALAIARAKLDAAYAASSSYAEDASAWAEWDAAKTAAWAEWDDPLAI